MSLGRMIHRQLSPVTDHVFLTGVGGVKDTAMLIDAKVTHVLNMAAELSDLTYPEHVEVRYVTLRDSENEDILPYLDELADYIHEVVTSGDQGEGEGRIVVHCVAGVSRSASVCIAYLVKHHRLSLKEAHGKVLAAREVIAPNLGFWSALIEYEERIRGSVSVELLPYVAGTVPNLDSYRKEMEYRIRLGWMDHVFFNMFVQCLFVSAQMLSTWFFHYDFT